MVTLNNSNMINAGAEKRFFIEMLVKDIELLPAIVDLVDNSVDGARGLHDDGDLNNQWVKIQVSQKEFVIYDNSGGISVDNARHYAFRFGRAKDFTGITRSVGQFGVGMKRAIFKLGRQFSVESTHVTDAKFGSRFKLQVDVDEWAAQDDWTFEFDEVEEVNPIATAKDTVGTRISVGRLHPSVSADLSDPAILQQLKVELRLRHQESIQLGLALYLNDEKLSASKPTLQASALIKPIYKVYSIETEGGTVDVRLYAGTVSPPNKTSANRNEDEGQAENFQDPGDAGWYLFCNDRLLLVADRTPITGWGSPAAAYHPQYRHFRGFVYLSADDSSLLPWNTTKTAVDRDSALFREVQSEMKTALVAVQGVLNRAKTERSRFDEVDVKPEILVAFDDAPDVPISGLAPSDRIVVPAAPVHAGPTGPVVRVQRIQYTIDPGHFNEVSRALGVTTGSEVGRLTFEYFYDKEIL